MTAPGNGTSFIASTQKPTMAPASGTAAITSSKATSAVAGASTSVVPYTNQNAAAGRGVAKGSAVLAFVGVVAWLF